MERHAKKLVLNKVTLRRLSSKDLKSVAGGGLNSNPPDGDTDGCAYHEQPAEGI
jgi:hypothetical protein